jgi:urease accessory protein
VSGVQGRLRLHFAHDVRQARTVMRVAEQQAPLRVIRAFPQPDGGVLVHLHNVSGGLLGGDDLVVELEVGPGARSTVTTTGATRLYRSRADVPPACQRMICSIGPGALLEWLPDPLIPFAGARYRQETHIDLATDAGFLGWEVLAPGREARAERFAFDQLDLHLDITTADRPIVLERMHLDPQRRPLDTPARMGIYRYLATLYCCHPGLPALRWQALEAELAEIAYQMSTPGACVWGASMLAAHGLLVRGLSVVGDHIAQDLTTFWRAAKRALYNAEAIPPRKVP